jgi:Ca2+-binding RTX toxin-like protein
VGYLGDGDDIWAGASLEMPQFIFGEAGNDQITTGQGDDIVVGGSGADVLMANSGRDLLFGGLGADQLFGQDGSDVLVAGKYEREEDLAALRLLLAAWQPSNSNFQTRVNRMRTGVGTDSNGRTVRLSIDLITDDAVDQLFGGKDSDWFLTNFAAEVKDLSGNESRN